MKMIPAVALLVASMFLYVAPAMAACVEGPANTFTCDTSAPNPDLTGIQESSNNNPITVNMIPGSGIDTTAASTPAVNLGEGQNQISLDGAEVVALDDNGIEAGGGVNQNTVAVTDSEVTCDDDCIDLQGTGNSTVNVTRSRVESVDNNGIDTDQGNDVITVEDSQVLAGQNCCNNFGIQTRAGNDEVNVTNSRVAGFIDNGTPWAILLGDHNDTITLGNGAVIDGQIRCEAGEDTIIFAMAVPDDELADVIADLATKHPANDSIEINGHIYEWLDCETLTNQLTGASAEDARATFFVDKSFTDGLNPTEVDVTINCFTGLPLTQTQTVTETQGVEFVVTDFDSGELDCEITEEELDGYAATYEPFGPGSYDSEGGCNFQDVDAGADNSCFIVNDAIPVEVEIEKIWVIDGPNGDEVDTSYKLTLYCDAQIEDADQCYGSGSMVEAPTGGFIVESCKKFYGDDSAEFLAHVVPEYPESHCWVEETVYDSGVEIDNDCSNLVVSAGEGASCTITNTVFFEGIPTLNQYGMALLALLMLGVGVVGFRRFV